MTAPPSQNSQQNSHRSARSHARLEANPDEARLLQDVLDRKKALDLQQEELDKQYDELIKMGKDLLNPRGSASRSERRDSHVSRHRSRSHDRISINSRSNRPKYRRSPPKPPRKNPDDRGKRRREGSYTGESSLTKSSDKFYGNNKSRVTPFTKELEAAFVNKDRKIPSNLEMYDGTGDPQDHTFSFEQIMYFQGHDAAAMCYLFLSTLKKTARDWVISLPPRSISSWEELQEQFHTRFGGNKRRIRMMTSLLQVKQRSNETLRQYMKRFREAVAEINGIDPRQIIQFLNMGLNVDKSGTLIEEIITKTPQTLSEAYERIDKFIELEEALANLQDSSRFNDDHYQRRDPRGDGADRKDSSGN